MSVQTEITRLNDARNSIRNTCLGLGIVLSTDKLDTIATKMETNLVNQGAVQAQVKEGETYTIPKGYHNGSGTVAGVKGGGNYNLQEKTVTPTKVSQEITSDDGYYGLSAVTVNPIPSQYADVSGTTAAPADVLVTKAFIDSSGNTATGTMPNNGKWDAECTQLTGDINIPKGYHDGTGKITVKSETKEVTPTKSDQSVLPTAGGFFSSVIVKAIPAKYVDVSDTDAVAANILAGKKAAVKVNNLSNPYQVIEGTMTDRGAGSIAFNALAGSGQLIPAGYYNGTGFVSLTDDLETALAAI